MRSLEGAAGVRSREAWQALPEAERAALEGELPPRRWFPVELHERLVTALRHAIGEEESARDAVTARVAERLLREAQQLGFASWVGSARGWSRVGPLLVTIPSRLLSETSWRLVPGDEQGRFAVDVRHLQSLSHTSQQAAGALLAALATRLMGVEVRVRSEWPAPDTVRFLARPVPTGRIS